MNKITIRLLATQTLATGLLGTLTSPIYLQIDLNNNTSQRISVTEVRLVSTIFFFFSYTLQRNNINMVITPRGKQSFNFDVRRLAARYGRNKRFKVEVKDNQGNWEASDAISLASII